MSKQFIETDKIETNVELIKCVSGIDSSYINFCIDKGVKGIVIEGMGRGNIPPNMVVGVEHAIAAHIPVVLVSRCFEGRVSDSYGYHGGGKELRSLGVIFADGMPGQKARVKLMLSLGKTNNIQEIREIFENGHYSG